MSACSKRSEVSRSAGGAKAGGPPGMQDVAHLAGVSPQTVSRVLSDHPNVREETRRKVLAAVHTLDYRRNNAASALSSGHSRTLGLIQLRISSYSRLAFAYGVEEEAARKGYAVNSITAKSSAPGAVADAISRLIDQGVEGIIVAVQLADDHDRLERLKKTVPCVTIDGLVNPSRDVVALDQIKIGRIATQHLLDLGHETVWHIAGPTDWHDAGGRARGWRETLEAAGRDVPPILHGDWSSKSGYRNGLVLGRIPEATSVFVASDDMAFGVLRALYELGRKVPADFSVVGVDDIPLAEYSVPPLTTVSQPFRQLGQLAVDSILDTLDVKRTLVEVSGPATAIEPRLVVRASTGAPSS